MGKLLRLSVEGTAEFIRASIRKREPKRKIRAPVSFADLESLYRAERVLNEIVPI